MPTLKFVVPELWYEPELISCFLGTSLVVVTYDFPSRDGIAGAQTSIIEASLCNTCMRLDASIIFPQLLSIVRNKFRPIKSYSVPLLTAYSRRKVARHDDNFDDFTFSLLLHYSKNALLQDYRSHDYKNEK